MFTISNGKMTDLHIWQAISLVALVLFLALSFQLSQVLRDREALHESLSRQDQPLENLTHIQNQLDALAVGTLQLSEKGDKNAKDIIDRMKHLGINVRPPAAPLGNQAPTATAVPQGKAKAPANQ